ncbi:TSUP family transporter [Solemya velesiana gill symbiont]|uniref:TSUP family transporter n=1 Tax=Solemya velesiana gill symbiont TaxID=1918948 RepID=UPI0026B64204
MLLSTGISPVQALATNKLQGSFGTFSSSLFFIRKKMIDLKQAGFMIGATFIGSMLGTLLVQSIDLSFLTAFIPILLILVALYFLFTPNIREDQAKQRIGTVFFGATVGFDGGFYDGFFGPGTGSFFLIGFVTLLGYGLIKATAHTKVLNFASNIGSLALFIVGGHVIWSLGLTMALGQFIGGRLGAHLAFLKGVKIIRPLIVIVTLSISLKLLFEQVFS